MVSDFETGIALTNGWWGEVGSGDLFADQVSDQCQREQAQVIETGNSIYGFVMALGYAVSQEAEHVQRPQTLALDDIEAQSAESEERR
ncbi:hypothetical protein [Streptomyces lacrimifluminis]|nr:hypothetical protein [Streptomyces lacrimifluminis]